MSDREDENSSDEIIRSTMSEIFLFLLFFFLIWLAFVVNDRTGDDGTHQSSAATPAEPEPDQIGQLENTIRGLEIALANSRTEVNGLKQELGEKEQIILVLSDKLSEYEGEEGKATNAQLIIIIGELEADVAELTGENEDQKIIIGRLKTETGELKIALADAFSRIPKSEAGPLYPPLIRLAEADGIYFRSGSAAPKDALLAAAKTAADTVIQYAEQFDANVVDVVGHADEVPVRRRNRNSNLDTKAVGALNGRVAISELGYADNVGLAMARAISFARLLRSELDKTAEGRRLRVLPYSAGQLIAEGDVIVTSQSGNEDEARRRLEVRVRRYTPEANAE